MGGKRRVGSGAFAIGTDEGIPIGVLLCRRFHRCGKQQRAKNARAPPRPPFAHLVDGLSSVALQGRKRIDWHERKIDFKAGLRSVRIGEIRRRNFQRLAKIWRQMFSERRLLGGAILAFSLRLVGGRAVFAEKRCVCRGLCDHI
jgi:hypothetical protein